MYGYICNLVAILTAIFNVSNRQPTHEFISHIIEFFNYENIALHTKIVLLANLVAILRAILDFSTLSTSNQCISHIPEYFCDLGNIHNNLNKLSSLSLKQNVAALFLVLWESWWHHGFFKPRRVLIILSLTICQRSNICKKSLDIQLCKVHPTFYQTIA